MEATSQGLLLWKKKLALYLEENYVPEPERLYRMPAAKKAGSGIPQSVSREEAPWEDSSASLIHAEYAPWPEPEATFGERLLSLIDEKGLEDVAVYKKAGLDRKLFSKIRGDRDYHPSKETVFALLLALECPIGEAKELLEFAGYSFSRSSKFDLVVKFCVEQRILDLETVNGLLWDNTGRTLSGDGR